MNLFLFIFPVLLIEAITHGNFLNFQRNKHLMPYVNRHIVVDEKTPIKLDEFYSFMSFRQWCVQLDPLQQITALYKKYLFLLAVNKHLGVLNIWELGYTEILAKTDRLEQAFMTKILAVHFHLYPNGGLRNRREYPRIILKAHLYMRQMEAMSRIDPNWSKRYEWWGILVGIEALFKVFIEESRSAREKLFLEISKQALESYAIHPTLAKSLNQACFPERTKPAPVHLPVARSQRKSTNNRNRSILIFVLLFIFISFVFYLFYSHGRGMRQRYNDVRIHPLL
jgi:hypothetical protein